MDGEALPERKRYGASWRARAALALLGAVMLVGIAPSMVRAAERGVLFLSSFSPTVPWTESMVDAVKAELAAHGAPVDQPINLYVEFLDRSRLPGTPNDEDWARFLATKYRGIRLDVIIADGAPAIKLIAGFGPDQFGPGWSGSIPVVGIFPNFNDLGDLAKAVTVRVTTGPHIDQTVDMALAHWPTARKMVIVSDHTELSDHLARIIRAALARRTDRPVEVEHLFDFRLEELESRLAALSRDTIVLYTHVAMDNSGRQLRPDEVVARLAKVSRAPVYALFGGDVGTGVVGGFVNDPGVAGHAATRAALALLDEGRRSAALTEKHYSSRAVVDWRQLRRWGISERRLPPGTEIRFRQPSVIEAYFVEAVVGLAFIGVLSAVLVLISILFVQRGRHAAALREANSRLEERVAARTRDIAQALAGEQTARQRLRTFIDMATHEFKTPLAVIDSSAQMLELLVGREREGVVGRLALIRRSVRRMIDLIETCLAGDRIDEELPMKVARFAPAALVRDVVERQRSHGAIIAADTTGLPDGCLADPELFGIALDALLDNARRYGPEGSPIDLTARQEGAALVVSVADRGPGVPEEEAARIFEKYYRGTHSRGTPGTGIGLSLVHTIAALHGGGIVHRARDGGGALFVLSIPVERKDTATEKQVLAAS